MGRAVILVRGKADRERAAHWSLKAPGGTRIEFKAARRTIDQNARMWAMLTDVARQATHCGRKYTADQWKVIMLHACGREVQFLPSLDGSTFIPWGQSSSDLSKSEMGELMDFIESWGAQHGVVFHGDAARAA